MKAIKSIALLLMTALCFMACSDDDNNEKNPTQSGGLSGMSWNNGEGEQSLKSGDELVFSAVDGKTQDLTIRFTTVGSWIATVVQDTQWCSISQSTGTKGSHSVIVSVSGETSTDRTATITFRATESLPTSFKVTQKATIQNEEAAVNEAVDEYLSECYLWNSEWKGLTKDLNQGYEDYFYNNLMSMTTNTLDKKYYYTDDSGNAHYTLFSYIQKKDEITDTRSTQIKKELEYSYGLTGLLPVQIVDKNQNPLYIVFCIEGVYPESPASESGLKRGDYIYKVDGNEISTSNYVDLFYDMVYPESVNSLTIQEWEVGDDDHFAYDDSNKPLTTEHKLTAKAMYKNPVLHHEVITAETGQKVGYLVYDNFDAGFDEELFDVFKEFKSANIQDLVLDLRYNGGGHVVSANMIASCVAGSYSEGRVFAKYRYNDERMKSMKDSDLEEKFSYNRYNNLGAGFSLSAGDLSLNRLYCLVSGETASASELVINSLRGINIDVTLIGETTHGKNVGMEVNSPEINGSTYEIAPITFQIYNAQGFSDYENGFAPTIELDETDYGNSHLFLDYGDRKEILLARALQEITGTQAATTRTSARRSSVFGKEMKRPVVRRYGHEGMIKPYQK